MPIRLSIGPPLPWPRWHAGNLKITPYIDLRQEKTPYIVVFIVEYITPYQARGYVKSDRFCNMWDVFLARYRGLVSNKPYLAVIWRMGRGGG